MKRAMRGRKGAHTRQRHDEIHQARGSGFLLVRNNRRGWELWNRWWKECLYVRRPFLAFVIRGRKTVDMSVENEPNLFPRPVCMKLVTLIEPALAPSGWTWADEYRCDGYGVRRECVETLAASILAVVLRDSRPPDPLGKHRT